MSIPNICLKALQFVITDAFCSKLILLWTCCYINFVILAISLPCFFYYDAFKSDVIKLNCRKSQMVLMQRDETRVQNVTSLK